MLLPNVDWMQVLANFVPVFFSGTAMFVWLAWYVGRRMERLLVIVSTVNDLQGRVVVIEIDMSAVKSDISAIKLSQGERREDFAEFRRLIDQLIMRNSAQ